MLHLTEAKPKSKYSITCVIKHLGKPFIHSCFLKCLLGAFLFQKPLLTDILHRLIRACIPIRFI